MPNIDYCPLAVENNTMPEKQTSPSLTLLLIKSTSSYNGPANHESWISPYCGRRSSLFARRSGWSQSRKAITVERVVKIKLIRPDRANCQKRLLWCEEQQIANVAQASKKHFERGVYSNSLLSCLCTLSWFSIFLSICNLRCGCGCDTSIHSPIQSNPFTLRGMGPRPRAWTQWVPLEPTTEAVV